jgi:hypothetical protein
MHAARRPLLPARRRGVENTTESSAFLSAPVARIALSSKTLAGVALSSRPHHGGEQAAPSVVVIGKREVSSDQRGRRQWC